MGSPFERLFAGAAKSLMAVHGEQEPAQYQPSSGDALPLSVSVDRVVAEQSVSGYPVTPSVQISWLKQDLASHARSDIITLASTERWRLSELVEDDGIFITYKVIPA